MRAGGPRGLPVAVLALLACGCGAAGGARPPYLPGPADMARLESAGTDPGAPSGAQVATALLSAPQVRLADLLRAVEAVSPEIAAATDEVGAASGRAWQAGLHPNPSLVFVREGPADRRPWGTAEFRAGVRQPIVVSDRRERAVTAELAEREVRELEVDVVRRQVLGEARVSFVDLVYLRDTVALHRELIAMARQTLELARERVQAGVALDLEALKPELEVRSLEAVLLGLERRMDGTRSGLEARMGGLAVPVDRLVRDPPASGDRDAAGPLLLGVRERHPAARAARRAVEAAQKRLDLARTASRPDITVGVEVGRNLEGNDFVGELGIEIPLAVFDAGQGRILEAQSLVSKARREAEAVENRLAAEVSRWLAEFDSARARLLQTRERLLPLAERSLEATREAYRNGRQEFLDLLDSQRTLLEARAVALALERETDIADAEVRTLTGDLP